MCKYVKDVKMGWKVSVMQGGCMVEADHIAFSFTSPKSAKRLRELNIPEQNPVLATSEKLQNSPSSIIRVRFWPELWNALGDCCNSPDRQFI